MIALLAAGMAGAGGSPLMHSADLLTAWGEQLWDTSEFTL